MIKRLFDIIFSLIAIILFFPICVIVALWIVLDTKGGVFYIQKRVGRDNKDFGMLKFRTMYANADKQGLLTIGTKDKRITPAGYFLRKYKIDELPQLLNVLIGQMSVVGPRPEVRKYVEMYTQQQLTVLSIKPGITDYASIVYVNENELLSSQQNPDEFYVKEVMPAKLNMNLYYIKNRNIFIDLKIIFRTVFKIIG
ncbi:MAG: sugar transferase [Bacteroidia bacterium]|nr:sugar transferase [Bacteroidia bacterium]